MWSFKRTLTKALSGSLDSTGAQLEVAACELNLALVVSGSFWCPAQPGTTTPESGSPRCRKPGDHFAWFSSEQRIPACHPPSAPPLPGRPPEAEPSWANTAARHMAVVSSSQAVRGLCTPLQTGAALSQAVPEA